jgi:hypothetical protein
VLLFLAKGFQSCFVIVLPPLYFLMQREMKRMFAYTILAASAIGIILMIVKLHAPAREWFACYYQSRLALTMQNVGATTDSYSEIIVRYFTELIPAFIIVVALIAFLRFKKEYPAGHIFKNFCRNRLAVALMLTSFAGAFPFALSLVQRGFYLLPAFVCMILSLVIGLRRYWIIAGAAMAAWSARSFVSVGVYVILTGAVFFCIVEAPKFKRDADLDADVAKMIPYFRKNDTALINEELWNYFSLHAQLYMQKQVNLSQSAVNSKYRITRNSAGNHIAGEGVVFTGRELQLMRRKQ